MWTNVTKALAVIFTLLAASLGAGQAGTRDGHGIAVATLESPQIVLIGKWVEDWSGRPIGRVRSVDVGREGKAEVVNIEVGAVQARGTQIVAIDAHEIVYYPQRAKLVASLGPSPVTAPTLPPNAPQRASTQRQGPQPTIFQD